MKGIILAGGKGTRLYPITKSVSKQILPLYDKPMIYYPISVLMLAGIKDILVISTKRDIPVFRELLGNGSKFGINLNYAVQDFPKGLADAFIVGENFINNDNVALVLGDNIFYGSNLSDILRKAVNKITQTGGAVIFGYYVKDPREYGVVEFDDKGDVLCIEEKPISPKSHYAIPGLYFYDNKVVSIAKTINPSKRGEIEITDVNNIYLNNDKLHIELLGRGMAWLDTGTYDSMLDAANFIAAIQKRQGLSISCLEEIAYRNMWINKKDLFKSAEEYKTSYGDYLKYIAENIII